MLFNSLEFAVFFPLVFGIYWLISGRRITAQNIWIVISGFIFYAFWDWRFLFLLATSAFCGYFSGLALESATQLNRQKGILIVSICINIGILFFFKYFNFFINSISGAFLLFGKTLNTQNFNIILPIGISFYTFQILSYILDVYHKKITPTRNLPAFVAYVSFFPQLLAGPIGRAASLLPQFTNKRVFDLEKSKDGLFKIGWGLLKKIVIADNCSSYVDEIFLHYHSQSSGVLFLGILLYSTQIYADFSGYSDMAIGTAKLLGFDLMTNFKMPNFSRDVAEFWRRWHISLSTWFRDYIYIPLGGSRGGKWMVFKNTMILFTISGLWHGANWTFVTWGFLNGLLFAPLILLNKNRKYMDVVAKGKFFPTITEVIQIAITYILISFTRIFFRSPDFPTAFSYLRNIFLFKEGSLLLSGIGRYCFEIVPLIIAFYFWEWKRREYETPVKNAFELIVVCLIILVFGNYSNIKEFIYFRF